MARSLLVLIALCALPSAASAATLRADYQFNGDRKSSVAGAPDLVDAGQPGLLPNQFNAATNSLAFGDGAGLSLETNTFLPVDPNYSVVVEFTFSDVGPITAGNEQYRRILNPVNQGDNGIYMWGADLVFYDTGRNPLNPGADSFVSNEPSTVIFTRNHTTKATTGWVDGGQTLTFNDVNNRMNLTAADRELRFFVDNVNNGVEESAGEVDRIRVFDGVLSTAEIDQLSAEGDTDNPPPPQPVAAPAPAPVVAPPFVQRPATLSSGGRASTALKGTAIEVTTGINAACPAGGAACTGTGTIESVPAGSSQKSKKKKKKAKAIKLGSTSLSVPAGQTSAVKIKLSSAGAAALKKAKTLKAKITVTLRAGAAAPATTTRTVTLKAPKAKKKKKKNKK